MGTIFRSGRCSSACALRRVLLVARTAPSGRSVSTEPRFRASPSIDPSRHTRTSRTSSPADGAELQSGRQVGGQVFETVHGEVGFATEERDFELLGEKSLGHITARQ